MLIRIAPVLFALLWSTGFIGAKLALPYAEPFTILSLRFVIVLAVLVPACLVLRAPWPKDALLGHALVAGLLIQGVYLGGVFWAIHRGMPAGVSALIVSLQPVLTAVLAIPLLGERVSLRHWGGLCLGLIGAVLVIWPKLDQSMDLRNAQSAGGISAATLLACGLSLLAITLGTVYQKRYAQGIDPRTSMAIQFTGSLVLLGPLAILTESRVVVWSPSLILAIAWLALVLSLGAISLLMLLIKQNAVSRVAAFFYLVPAITAVMAWALFDEMLVPVQLAGMALVTVAVMLTGAPARPAMPASAG